MHHLGRLACLAGASVLLHPAMADSVDTAVNARLLTPLSSYSSRPGATISAVMVSPVCAAGGEIPEGATIEGTVKRVTKVGLGLIHESAGMRLEFTRLALPDGREFEVEARLTGIDNARERIDQTGYIHGIRATATLSNRAGERLAVAALDHPAVMLPILVVESTVLHFPDPEMEFRRGTELELDVRFPESFGPIVVCDEDERQIPAEVWDELQQVVDDLPVWSYSKRQPQPMDLVNLAFIGSDDAVRRAFDASGWIASRANSAGAAVTAIRAIAEDRAFADAPMRTLLLDGREPDFRVEKSLDTFAKRDHLRVWKRSGNVEGDGIWAAAATRDVAATFALHPFGFTHQIENDVDRERDKVVRDLVYTGCADSVAYLRRDTLIRGPGVAHRRGVITDRRVAVVTLNACTEPREYLGTGPQPAGPGRTVRWVRRVTLTVRNHFLRDNIVWRTADAVRIGYRTMRDWRQQRRDELQARSTEEKLARNRHP